MSRILTEFKDELLHYYDSIGELLPKLIVAIILMIIIRIIATRGRKRLVSYLSDKTSDPLMAKFVGRIFALALLTIAIIIGLNILGMGKFANGLMGTAGVGAFIIGFAFKDIGEHFLAGFILAFNRPFNVGDLVELDGQKGTVISLNIIDTHLKTFDGRDLYIPNGNIIKNTLVNYTIDGFMRYDVSIGLDYDTDLKVALSLIEETMFGIDGILQEGKAPSIAIDSLGSSTLNLKVFYWLDTFDKSVNGSKVKINIVDSLLNKLTEAGINLPGDIVEIKNYNQSRFEMNAN